MSIACAIATGTSQIFLIYFTHGYSRKGSAFPGIDFYKAVVYEGLISTIFD